MEGIIRSPYHTFVSHLYRYKMEQNKFAKTLSFIKHLSYKIAIPCYKELPFIMLSIYMMNNLSQSFDSLQIALGSQNAYYAIIGNFLVLFLFAYIGATIITFIKSKILYISCKTLLYLGIISLYIITHFLLQNFGMSISPTCLVLLAETTSKEASEFTNQYIFSNATIPTIKMTSMFLFIIIVSEVLWSLFKNKIKIHFIINNIFYTSISFLLLFSCSYSIFITWKTAKVDTPDQFINMITPSNPIFSIYKSFIITTKMAKNINYAISLNEDIAKNNKSITTTSDSLNIVIVLGESHIKHHSQLYGYPLKTSPLLIKEKDNNLYIFNDVITSSNQTSNVIKNILCCNNSSNGEYWHKSPFIPTIFKSAGYNVYFWSNQYNFSQLATFSFTLNNFLYNPSIINISYSKKNNISYNFDEDIVNSFIDSVEFKSNKHNLILFHLNGQHHDVRERFPSDKFKHFNADSINRNDSYLGTEEKEYIADYDNAILYNDYVLHKIIEEFRNSNSILIYLSDHGEEVYDYREQKGRDQGPLTANKLKYQYEIPFMVWCSDIYKTKYPEKVTAIRNAVNRPFISDNLCNMLFNLGNIETPFYRDSLDLISPNYKCKKRRINNDFVYENIRYNPNL